MGGGGGGASIMSIGLLHGHVTRQKIHSNTLPEIVTIAIARNRRKYIKTYISQTTRKELGAETD